MQNNKLKKEITYYRKQLQKVIFSLLENGPYNKTLAKIDEDLKTFSSQFSKILKVFHGANSSNISEQILKLVAQEDTIVTAIEFNICGSMKFLRQSLDEKVIENLLKIDNEFIVNMEKGHLELKNSLDQFNQLGFDLFDQWDKQQFEEFVNIGYLHSKDVNINFAELLNPKYKNFIRQQLGIQKRATVKKSDIENFFEFYQCKYHAKSPLILDFFSGVSTIVYHCENKVQKGPKNDVQQLSPVKYRKAEVQFVVLADVRILII